MKIKKESKNGNTFSFMVLCFARRKTSAALDISASGNGLHVTSLIALGRSKSSRYNEKNLKDFTCFTSYALFLRFKKM